VPLNGQFEVSNSYYNTVWGEGVVSRYPLAQPYPQFTSQAVLTRILDCAKFIRMVPTGSYTVYALEFKHDKDCIYALWTPRGEVNVKLDFGGVPVKRIGFYGEESPFTGENAVITKEPCYFV